MPHASDSSSPSFTIQIPLLIRFRTIIFFSFVHFLSFFAFPSPPISLKRKLRPVKKMEKKEAGAVKVIDKERDGSKTVIARGKKKEQLKTRGRKTGCRRCFYISQRCCIRSERAGGRKKDKGRKKNKKSEVKCLAFFFPSHPCFPALGVPQSISLLFPPPFSCARAISCSRVNSSGVLFMKGEEARRHGKNISRKEKRKRVSCHRKRYL